MAAIKAYSHWLLQLYTESTRINQEKDQFYKIIVTLIEAVSQLTNKQVGKQENGGACCFCGRRISGTVMPLIKDHPY